MKYIKNSKGITLTSLIVYILAMLIIIGVMSTITKYYYRNLNEINKQVDVAKEYTKLNSYLSEDVNNPYNIIEECKENSIVFYNYTNAKNTDRSSGYNQYTFIGDSIYFNKIKICRGVKTCRFIQDETEPETKFTLNITFENNEVKNVSYSIRRLVDIKFEEREGE